uniref:Retrotransposon gag domain-containing protein n=1 Tax=Cannabis sativa TaxID=3483 RepID=A0A803PT47_CANSA
MAANNNIGLNNNQPTLVVIDAQPRAVRDYFLPVPALINMVQHNQFGRLATEDPNIHLAIFLEVCAIVKMNGVTDDAIRLRLFPSSLRDRVRKWLQSMQPCSISTWDEMARKFMVKFFPPSKSAQLRSEIGQFRHLDSEPFYEAWERSKDLLRHYPQHGYESWMQVSIFYNGLNGPTRTLIDAAVGGALLSKHITEAINLLEEMATNSYNWPNERNTHKKLAGLHEVDPMTNIAAQISALSNQEAALVNHKNTSTVENVVAASTSQGPEMSIEQAQYMAYKTYNNNYRGNPMPNYYHPGLRNHENLSYGNTKNVLQLPSGFNTQQQEDKKYLEDILGTFMIESKKRFNKNEARLNNIETHISNMDASMKNIEVQVRKLANVSSNQADTENTCNMVESCNSNEDNRETNHNEKTKKPRDKKKLKEEFLIGKQVLVIHSKFKSLTSNVISRWKDPFKFKELLPCGLVSIKSEKGEILKVHKRKLKACTDELRRPYQPPRGNDDDPPANDGRGRAMDP